MFVLNPQQHVDGNLNCRFFSSLHAGDYGGSVAAGLSRGRGRIIYQKSVLKAETIFKGAVYEVFARLFVLRLLCRCAMMISCAYSIRQLQPPLNRNSRRPERYGM
jgi:hypothetical protein